MAISTILTLPGTQDGAVHNKDYARVKKLFEQIVGVAIKTEDLNDLAKDSIDVLCENYPDHPNLAPGCTFDSVYTLDGLQRSWINQATLGLFDPPEPPQFNYRPKS